MICGFVGFRSFPLTCFQLPVSKDSLQLLTGGL